MTPLLSGIRVVDLTSVIMGPFATFQLGTLGADVIKVEPPGGETVRHIAPARNPGMGANGLYYYYHTFAKTLDAVGHDTIEDAEGVKHDWRRELIDELARRQNDDGSWVNKKSPRWIEGDPNLVTGYALLALSYCKVKVEKKD